jgi:hypothetical protein
METVSSLVAWSSLKQIQNEKNMQIGLTTQNFLGITGKLIFSKEVLWPKKFSSWSVLRVAKSRGSYFCRVFITKDLDFSYNLNGFAKSTVEGARTLASKGLEHKIFF